MNSEKDDGLCLSIWENGKDQIIVSVPCSMIITSVYYTKDDLNGEYIIETEAPNFVMRDLGEGMKKYLDTPRVRIGTAKTPDEARKIAYKQARDGLAPTLKDLLNQLPNTKVTSIYDSLKLEEV